MVWSLDAQAVGIACPNCGADFGHCVYMVYTTRFLAAAGRCFGRMPLLKSERAAVAEENKKRYFILYSAHLHYLCSDKIKQTT